MKKTWVGFFSLCLLLTACTSGSNETAAVAEPIDEAAYTLEQVPGSACEKASIANADGFILETGFICDGKKSGTWTYYSPTVEWNQPTKIISYLAGNYNGTYMEINDRGQIELLANYKNNKLHGAWGKYRFGRPEITAHYKDGVLDGVYQEVEFRDGTLKKEVNYKDGKEHGKMSYYDELGRPVLEYEYKNGEKISEQVIEQPDVAPE